jgi:DNA-binding IclR family transcriptional regulator
VDRPMKNPPAYVISSVDHALRLATMLQLEGPLTLSVVAERLGVARSTAHRLLAMLVYRDFAAQDASRAYHAGPVLEIAVLSRSQTAELRTVALPHLQKLVDRVGESVNLCVRTGSMVRFIASIESPQSLRVGSREGMVFPAHRTTAGLLLLAELPREDLAALYRRTDDDDMPLEKPDLEALEAEFVRARRYGFVLNKNRSERGVVAIGVPVRGADGGPVAGLSVSMPTARYDRHLLRAQVSGLTGTARAIEANLGEQGPRSAVHLRQATRSPSSSLAAGHR